MNKSIVEYTKLKIRDNSKFYELVLLFNVEFESSNPNYVNLDNIEKLLKNPNFVCFVATIDGKVVGGLTGFELEMYDREGSSMYIYDLAVINKCQRKGIGSRLVYEMIEYCKSKSIKELFVQADSVDQHAIKFYKKIGGEQTKTFHFSFDTSNY
ncbi:GNAT family N-acetyltransferase [Paenibacillus sp. FSL W7-1279]|uniref:GNAT family N-acetyltransferase n=1 Tax=Paenibacillus sp. FSL W7-1279 TaxID=2921697 RepID=UPI0030DC2282